MPTFSKTDHLLETELYTIECYSEYQLEAPLNSFTDASLNDHMCNMYKKKQLETSTLMQKLVSFFLWRYQNQLKPQIRNYLESKKLTLEDWLKLVKDNRRGDILYIYVLSMITGRYTCIHLRNKKLWHTLHAVPVKHDELLNRCELHQAYLKFGIFLRLQR